MSLTIHLLHAGPNGTALEFDDSVERIVLGRDPQRCQVVFPADLRQVGREHCALVRRLGRYRLEKPADHLVLVDGVPAVDGQELADRSALQLGPGGPLLTLSLTVGGAGTPTQRQWGGSGLKTQVAASSDRSRRAAVVGLSAVVLGLAVAVVSFGLNSRQQSAIAKQGDAIEQQGQQLTAQAEQVTRHTAQLQTQQQLLAQAQQSVTVKQRLADLGDAVERQRAELATVTQGLEQQGRRLNQVEAEVETHAPGLAAAAARIRPSVLLVATRDANGQLEPCGTAWVLDQSRGLLATNAHVAEAFYSLGAGDDYIVRRPGTDAESPQDYRITSVVLHPDYSEFEVAWGVFQPAAVRAAFHIEQIEPAGGACDVALMYVEPAADLPPGLPLASTAALADLAAGVPVASVGYPMEGLVLGGVNVDAPAPQSHFSYITAMTDYFGADTADASQRLLIQHAAPAAGGSSGSPMINIHGEVIGVVSGGNLTRAVIGFNSLDAPIDPIYARFGSSSGIFFAQRSDLLAELQADPTMSSRRRDAWDAGLARYYTPYDAAEARQVDWQVGTQLQQWRASIEDSGLQAATFTELTALDGSVTEWNAPEPVQSIEITEPGEVFVMASVPQSQHVGLRLPDWPDSVSQPYSWLATAQFRTPDPGRYDAAITELTEPTDYHFSVWHASVHTRSPEERREWIVSQWIEAEGASANADAAPIEELHGELDEGSDRTQKLRLLNLLTPGDYLGVVDSDTGADLDLAVYGPGLESLGGDVRADSFAWVPFAVAEAGEHQLVVTSPSAGVSYRLFIYRLAHGDAGRP